VNKLNEQFVQGTDFSSEIVMRNFPCKGAAGIGIWVSKFLSCMQHVKNQEQRQSVNRGTMVAVIIAALVVAGGVTLLVLYPTTDQTSFYIVVAAMILAPIFLLAAFLLSNKRQ
jgi:hypothetical protein